MGFMESCLDKLVVSIQDSEEYQSYLKAKVALEKDPVKMQRANEFRVKNYNLQSTNAEEDLFEAMDQLEQEYNELQNDAEISDFLQAELSLCRLLQEINRRIVMNLDFQIS